jgi:DNA-binding transcriptional MerR regulator
MKVGELARRAGLTVRTLHHYDHLGLLSPSARTESGHRLYTDGDIRRLHQILALRQLGLGLDRVRECLAGELSPAAVIEMQREQIRSQIEALRRLAGRLEQLAEHQRANGQASIDEVLRTMEEMMKWEKYYTPDQLEQLRQRREAVGEERIREVEAEWPRLMAEVQAEIDAGTDPADPRALELANRCMALVREFSGGDPGIESSAKSVWQNEQSVQGMDTGPMRAMMEFVSRALDHAQR